MRRQQMKIGMADEAESIQRLYLDGHKHEAAARGPTQGTRRLASRPTSPQDTNGGIGSA